MKLLWDIEWKTTALTLFLLPSLIWLGFWQLERAEEKALLAKQYAQQARQPAVPITDLLNAPDSNARFRRVLMQGYFDPGAVVLLDNQIRDGRYGHDVFNVFYDTASQRALLLNRGWISGDPARQSLPAVEIPEGEMSLEARVYISPGKPYLLQEDRFSDVVWPLLVQTVASEELRGALETRLNRTLYPRELRLLPTQAHGFRRDWPVVNVSPSKHQGYAVQWFTMAAALALLFLLRSSNLWEIVRRRGTGSEH
ncbi:MAG: SURF1 family protein [Pseudomonadota bacterium]